MAFALVMHLCCLFVTCKCVRHIRNEIVITYNIETRAKTRMHSSRMHTARSSSHRGGSPSWVVYLGGLPGGGSPWRGVSLAGGLPGGEVSVPGGLPGGGSPWWGSPWWGPPWQGVSLVGGLPGGGLPGGGKGSPWQGVSLAGGVSLADPPVNRMTDACENITLPQTSFAGGNKPK